MTESGPSGLEPEHAPRSSWERFEERFGKWFWPAIPVVAALIALRGAFSTSEVFYIRDLSYYFWPEHLWLRSEILSGAWPLWDPYTGCGQSAYSDPVRQLFFPPTLLARVLLPPVLGFNVCVAAPFPVAGLGLYLFLRRMVSRPASALGAMVFALSGPMLSTGNFFNLSWSIAITPWLLLLTSRLVESPSARRFSALAVAFALQFLAGESVTLFASAALAVAYGVFAADTGEFRLRALATRIALVMSAGLTAVALAAIQALPLLIATFGSSRVGERPAKFATMWSLHPVTLVESVVPFLFGDPTRFGGVNALQWHSVLNSGREPFIFSIYLGVAGLGLVLVSLCAGGDRRRWFWLAVAGVALICALGHYTPLYPALQRAIPPLQAFRYSSKYVVFVPLALAPLAAHGYEVIVAGGEVARRAARIAIVVLGVLAVLGAAVAILAIVGSGSALDISELLGAAMGVYDPVVAGKVVVASMSLAGPALFGVAVAAVWCMRTLTVGRDPDPLIRTALLALVALDLLLAGKDLNPTADAAFFQQASWVDRVHERPDVRVYIGGRLASAVEGVEDPDRLITTQAPPVTGLPPLAERAQGSVFFATFPSAWRIRDSMSYDNAALWPREYGDIGRALRIRSRDERIRLLRRLGVGYFLVPWADWPDGTPLERYADRAPLALYEGPPPSPRVSVVSRAEILSEPGAILDRMFEESYDPAASVLLEAGSPEPLTDDGPPPSEAAEIVSETSNEVIVSAAAGEHGGYLVLLDSFSPDWRVTIDGEASTILRANSIFRAVRLAPGIHRVRFYFSPRVFISGASISTVTGLALFALSVHRPKKAQHLLPKRRVGSSK